MSEIQKLARFLSTADRSRRARPAIARRRPASAAPQSASVQPGPMLPSPVIIHQPAPPLGNAPKQERLAAVTGAGGFIGSHVVEALLEAGWSVRALVHYNSQGRQGHLEESLARLEPDHLARLDIKQGDVTDRRCVRALVEGCSLAIHMAALIGIPYSYVAPESYVNVNIGGTLAVLEGCREAGVARLIHTSTSEVYGTARTTPMHEEHPLQAQSPYAATKCAADKLVESYVLSFGLPAVTVRPFNTYGPRQSLRAIIPTIVAQALSPACQSIKLGALDPVRDFTFVMDTARAFVLLADAPAEKILGGTFNLGSGRGISMGSLVEMVQKTLGTNKPVVTEEARQRPAASEVRMLISDPRLVKMATGWRPETGLEEGIKAVAEHLKPRLQAISPAEYMR